MIGITREDVEDTSVVEIWPENMLPLQVFQELGTQWNVGMNGPTGLNHAAIPVWMDVMGVRQKQRLEVMRAIGIMEREALKQMSKRD